MYAMEKVSSIITRGVYTVSGPFHPFGGAVDIIVVQQQDGSFKSSPWYVRFGKFQGVLKTREKVVNIAVNGIEAGFHMYLDSNGEAYFLKDTDPNAEGGEFVVSPASSGDERDDQAQNDHLRKSKSSPFNSPTMPADVGDGRIVARTRRTTILERVFGRKSGKENSNSVDRVSSLERAEIAAELLDTKWSTNLSTRGSRTSNSKGEPSKSNETDAGNADQGEISQIALPEDNFDHGKVMNSNRESVDGNFGSPLRGRDSSEDGNNHDLASIRVEEEVIEIYTHETGDLTNRITSTSDQVGSESLCNGLSTDNTRNASSDSRGEELLDNSENDEGRQIHIEEITTSHEVVEIHAIEKGTMDDRTQVVSQIITVDSDGIDLHFIDAASPTCDTIDVINERHEVSLIASSQDASQKGVATISSSGTVQSSNVLSSILADKVHDAVDISLTDGVQLEEYSDVSIEKGEPISEERPLSDHDASSNKVDMNNLDVQDTKVFVFEDSNSQIFQANCLDKDVFMDTIANDHSTDSIHDASCGQDLVFCDTSPSVEILSSVPEIVHPEDITKNFTVENATCNGEIDVSRTQSSMEEGETRECSSLSMSTILQPANFPNEVESPSMPIPDSSNVSKDIEVQDLRIGFDSNKSCSTDGVECGHVSEAISRPREAAHTIVSFSENVEEIQFQFSDTESFIDKDTVNELSANEAAGTGEHELLISGGDAEEHEGDGVNHEQNSENYSDSSRPETSPIPIPGSELYSGENNLEARSLPNLRSHIHDLERSDILHQLSRSLDSNGENNGVGPVKTANFGFSELDGEGTSDAEESDSAPELTNSTVPDHEHAHSLKVNSFNPFVELSLCEHLLSEGMGDDAARKAFDSEKVTLEKFRAMGQSLIKNNKLVVRIAGRYFPWDAAAPIVLGMVSFGEEQVFEPRGMIKVERADAGNTSRAIVASGGSWRIWPFSFRRARTMNTIRSVRESSDESSFSTPKKEPSGETDVLSAKRMERKVRSLTPTSEELASLNLREGRNVITFTFSTAMLGKQQVDARIYLWKWNTRIVISDVDGTITKSDVLGQFMPLVGVDWSQTGVAHLFSAIKENGYQLLFLSARAISQAHLTRQFLFNLKQDGKALPDGPVVISPDGLFPSLYREVIRRAPHEFKISCLEVIKALFPPDSNPFYAGFGNRDTDELSYLKVGIPMGKIFIINPKGEVAVNRRVDTKSYSSLHALVNGMFPPMSSSEQEDYNSWNYWKLPLPNVDM